eukprot:scaffold8371_cov66-Phaeocystis_antarctica.AAC.5
MLDALAQSSGCTCRYPRRTLEKKTRVECECGPKRAMSSVCKRGLASWDTVSPGYRHLSWGYAGVPRMPPVSQDAKPRLQRLPARSVICDRTVHATRTINGPAPVGRGPRGGTRGAPRAPRRSTFGGCAQALASDAALRLSCAMRSLCHWK